MSCLKIDDFWLGRHVKRMHIADRGSCLRIGYRGFARILVRRRISLQFLEQEISEVTVAGLQKTDGCGICRTQLREGQRLLSRLGQIGNQFQRSDTNGIGSYPDSEIDVHLDGVAGNQIERLEEIACGSAL